MVLNMRGAIVEGNLTVRVNTLGPVLFQPVQHQIWSIAGRSFKSIDNPCGALRRAVVKDNEKMDKEGPSGLPDMTLDVLRLSASERCTIMRLQ